MKTLYVNISDKPISASEEVVVLDYDLIGDFFFYLGDKIADGCKVASESALISKFNTLENKHDYDKILSQWDDVKRILLGDDITGVFNFELPSGYFHWLRYNEEYNHIYETNFSRNENKSITIELEELYEESILDLQRKILRKLKRDDLYLDIDEIVFSDEEVTRKSSVYQNVKTKFGDIGFKSYRKWVQEKNQKNDTSDKENPTTQTCIQEFFPYKGISLGTTPIESIDCEVIAEEFNAITYKKKDTDFNLLGIKGQKTFIGISISSFPRMSLPWQWSSILGCDFRDSYDVCHKALINNNFLVMARSETEIFALTGKRKYHVRLFFDEDMKFDILYLFINECPYCGSQKFKLIGWIDGCFMPFCTDCDKPYVLQDNADDVKSRNESTNNGFTFNSFFPVCGITLNETTIQDVGRKVHNCDEIEYKDDGTVYVWINNGKSGAPGSVISKENNSIYFTSIYMTREDLMFWEWRNLGFDWNLKYKDWVSLFKNMEFTLIQTDPYKSQCEGTPNNYDAGIIAISKDGLLKFHLEFTSDRNYVKHSRLYSISAYSKDYCCDVDSVRETFYNLEDVYCKKKKYL